jgi:hypothetical protein
MYIYMYIRMTCTAVRVVTDSRAVRYLGSRYRTRPGYMGPEHQTGVVNTTQNEESRIPVTVVPLIQLKPFQALSQASGGRHTHLISGQEICLLLLLSTSPFLEEKRLYMYTIVHVYTHKASQGSHKPLAVIYRSHVHAWQVWANSVFIIIVYTIIM